MGTVCLGRGQRPGLAPAGDSLSFASPKESKPRKSDPTGCVPSLRCGQPAVLSFAGVSLNSRRFASLKQTRALIRQNLRSSAHPEGNPKPDIHTGHCCARPKPLGRKRRALRRLGRAQQWPVWLFGCSAAHPHLAAPAAGRLRGEHARRSAHASSTDSPWLSERSAPARSEFHGAPRNRPDAGLPRSNAKGSQTEGRLSFAYFSLARQRKVSRPPGRDPASALTQRTHLAIKTIVSTA